MITNKILFLATKEQPNPIEVDYWIDLVANPYGGIIKYFNGEEWITLNVGTKADLFDYYTKAQVNELLNSKVDDDPDNKLITANDLATTVKGIELNPANTDVVNLAVVSYNGDATIVHLPNASSGQAGIVSAADFNDFVKQHQLSDLHIEMIDALADIRSKYQKALKAGKNITIDDDNTINAVLKDEVVSWEQIYDRPDFDQLRKDVDNKVVKGTEANNTPTDLLVDYNEDYDISIYTTDLIDAIVSNEKNRALKAEKSLDSQIAEEKTRAVNKEAELLANIDAEATARLEAVDAETTRATAAENKLISDMTLYETRTNASLNTKADKSDTYTKSEVDTKVSSVYRVLGSCEFKALPTTNTVGDVYNVTDKFTLNDQAYEAGTNVVWTSTGWDALSGSFDTSAIESKITAVATDLSNTTDALEAADTVLQKNIDTTNQAITAHTTNTSNPHKVTKAQVGLSNVDNTSDANKPISTATLTALDNKADVSTVTAVSDSLSKHLSATNPHNITKSTVGLSNVDNTSDKDKPISSATLTALDSKVDKVDGKQLSTEDYTTTEKNKLAGIAAGAQVNVQSDWQATEGDAYIKNKPTLGTLASQSTVTKSLLDSSLQSSVDLANNSVQQVAGKQLSTEDYTTAEKTKLAGLNNYDDTDIQNELDSKVSVQNSSNTAVSSIIIDETVDLSVVEVYTKAQVDEKILSVQDSVDAVDSKLIVDEDTDTGIEVYTKAQIDAIIAQLKQNNNLI